MGLGADGPSPERWHVYDREWNANGHESFGDVEFFRYMVGTLARSATRETSTRRRGDEDLGEPDKTT